MKWKFPNIAVARWVLFFWATRQVVGNSVGHTWDPSGFSTLPLRFCEKKGPCAGEFEGVRAHDPKISKAEKVWISRTYRHSQTWPVNASPL